jgi:phosphonate transport system substrate-binding protein
MTLPRQITRRGALALTLPAVLAAADADSPVRLGISASQMAEVNLSDARAAMKIWISRGTEGLKIAVDPNGKMVYTSTEILEKIRKHELDAVAISILEYRQVADLLDSSQIICTAGKEELEQYIILVKRNGPIHTLADLRGRQLRMLKSPRMCVAPAWLSTLLDEHHFGSAEQFFGSVTADSKASQVVLPVFFGKADACLTLKRTFDTIGELNPQVVKDLSVLAASPGMVVGFFIFRKNFHNVNRDKVILALSSLPENPAARQFNTLFQFDAVDVRGADCLTPALSILDAADAARGSARAPKRGTE